MHEELYRTYRKEEEFVGRFYSAAWKASCLLDGHWKPNRNCNDLERQIERFLLSTCQQSGLLFKSAAVYHDPTSGLLTSIEISLESSTRVVKVRVSKEGDDLTAKKMADKKRERAFARVA